jgi:acid phosphatase family membrane protein YuiD
MVSRDKIMDYSYFVTPFLAWLAAGFLKFIINSIKAKKFAFGLIGYGGLPSNHTAIVTAMPALIFFKGDIDSPIFGVAITIAFIVMLDASSLRKQVGYHAYSINKILKNDSTHKLLRDRMGHTPLEILSGVFVGLLVSYSVFKFI